MSKVKIILNGEDFAWKADKSIKELIESLDLEVDKIAIERNLEIVDPEEFSKTVILENDKIEIVSFIGGG